MEKAPRKINKVRKKLNPIILQVNKQSNILTYPKTQSVFGTQKVTSNPSELTVLLQDIDDTTSLHSQEKKPTKINQKKNKSKKGQSVAESLLPIKKTIPNDKLIKCPPNIQPIQSLKISEVVSTLDDQTFSNLSNEQLMEISKKLWLPTKTDLPVLDLTLSNGYSQNIMSHSWFPIKKTLSNPQNKSSLKTCCPSFTSCLADKTADVNISLPNLDLTRKQILNRNKKPKKRSRKHPTKLDPNKKKCQFVVTTEYNSVVYGRICGDICCGNKSDRCESHLYSKEREFELYAMNTCQHIITQKSRGKDRKGMICGNFTFDSKNNKYCKEHISRHPELENIDNSNTCLRSFKVRFYPTKNQKKLYEIHFGGARFTFNKCVEDKIGVNSDSVDELGIKDKYVTKMPEKYEFLKLVPKEVRAFALKEYLTSLDNSQTAYENKLKLEEWKEKKWKNYVPKEIKKPEIKFRNKKSNQSITINKDSVKIKDGKLYIYVKIFNNEHIEFMSRAKKKDKRLNKIMSEVLFHDIKIIKTPTNKYYICFTDDHKKEKLKSEIKEDEINACAVDPGGRTAFTTYSENEVYEIGTDMNDKLGKLFKTKDELKTIYRKKMIEFKNKKIQKKEFILSRNNYRKINEKIRNMINDLHYKAINKLMDYQIILISRLNTKKIIEQEDFNKKAKNVLQTLCHGQFIRRLIEKGELEGKHVIIVSEYLTSQTCGLCFSKHKTKSKTYECQHCDLIIDRDVNGARNIYIKFIGDVMYMIQKKLL